MKKLILLFFILFSFASNAQIRAIATMRSDTDAPTPPTPEDPFVITDDHILGTQGYQFNYAVGTWIGGTGIAGWYNTTLYYTGTTNGYVEFTFNGTSIHLFTEKKDTHGIMAISIDGGAETNVDLYSASPLLQQDVWNSGTISQAVHTVKIRCTGTKNASSSNYYAIVDYLKVYNPLPVEETPDPDPTFTHYVKTTGSNTANNCTNSAAPCLTIGYALTQMSSGHVLSVGPGTFVEPAYLAPTPGESIHGSGVDVTIVKLNSSLNWDVTAGAIQASKTMFQYNTAGSTAHFLSDLTIEGNGKLVHAGIYIANGRNNVTVEDVKITNFDYFGAYVAANNITFHNVQIINSAEAHTSFSTGNLMVGGLNTFTCDNVDISDNLEGYGVKSFGAGVIIESMLFENSEVRVVPYSPYGGSTVPNIAFEFESAKPRNCIIRNSYFDNNISIVRAIGSVNEGFNTVHITNNIIDTITKGAGGTTSMNASIEFSSHNGEISHNHIVGGRFAYIVSWNTGETTQQQNLRVHHNTVYMTGHVNSPTGLVRASYHGWNGLYIYNNTVHIPPTQNYNVAIVYNGANGVTYNSTNVQVKNNIIYDQSTSDGGVGGANAIVRMEGSGGSFTSSNFSYNLINGMSTTLPGGWTSSDNLTSSPQLQGGGGVNPSPFTYTPFYKPALGSPVINTGINVGLPFTGAAPTRGRLEYP